MTLTGISLYLQNRYSNLASALGWDDTTYSYITSDILEGLNISNESDVSTNELHKVGIVYLLRQALRDISTHLESASSDGGSYSWGDLQAKLINEFNSAKADAFEYIGNIVLDEGDNKNPYQYDYDRDVTYGNY